MTVALTNFASTLTNSLLSAVGTSFTVLPATGVNFPATVGGAWFYVTLVDSLTAPTVREIIKVTNRSSDSFSTIVRAQDGTTALAWPVGTSVELRLTAGTFADLTTQYANNADNLSALASASAARTNLGLGDLATQNSNSVTATGGNISGFNISASNFDGIIGFTTPDTILATTIGASGVITSSLATGTSPFSIASTTVVPNLNVSQLLGLTWTVPGTIGSGTPSSGAFTTLAANSTVSGAGFTAYFASPPALGGTVPAAGTFTTVRATTSINYRGLDNASATNSGFGEGVLAALAGGTGNTAVGNATLAALTLGVFNTALGASCLLGNTTGYWNVAVGAYSLYTNKTGGGNVAIGFQAMLSSVSPLYNIAIGKAALQNVGKTVTAGAFIIGIDYTIITAGSTVFTSIGALDNNPGTVFTCTGVGSGTGTASSNVLYNIGIGYQALNNNNTGQYNYAFGYNAALGNEYGAHNIALGTSALATSKVGINNIAIGQNALTAAGPIISAGSFAVGTSYTIRTPGTTDFTLIGAANSIFGTVFTATGVGVGDGTASANSNYNTAVGYNAGSTLTTGINNTLLGASSAVTSTNQTNSTALGFQATATADNQVVLGNSSVTETVLRGQVKGGAGTGTGQPVMVGTLSVNTTAVGNVGAGTDDLMTYTLPANSLSANNKGVRVTAWGTSAANGNTKTIDFLFGSTTLATNSASINPSAGIWRIMANIFRSGASNQVFCVDTISKQPVLTSTFIITDVRQGVSTETDTAAIIIKCTGSATADNDIVQTGMIVEFIN